MYRYADPTRYVAGVPARDLTDAEWAALTDAQKALCLDLYIYIPPAKPARPEGNDG